MARVVVAMSGGVDSSVAAALLCEAGHEVIGVFMRHGHQPDTVACSTPAADSRALPIVHTAPRRQGCCSAADAHDARAVADRLDIPFYALNMDDDFGRIMDYFVAEYVAGRTPNPCVACNNWLKFGKLLDYADAIGADYVASGHYARLVPGDDGVPGLYRGLDGQKDQSYVLFGVRRDDLPRILFPVGGQRKEAIRRRAAGLGLPVADKPDSQEICFVPDGDYARFVQRQAPGESRAGEIVTTDGRVVGAHDGYERFTVGQRKGLGVALGDPYFVVRIEPESRRVVIGRREELARSTLTADRANWLVDVPAGPFDCQVQIRYNSRAVPATVERLSPQRFQVRLQTPQCGVAPGQAAVCYDADRVLGGGWIE